MGEKSKFIGQLGEDLANAMLDRLGWSKAGAWNQDIPCENSEHKTAKKKDSKRTHGVDAVYCYTNPYDSQDDVILIEAKAVSWFKKGNSIKSANTLGTQLHQFVNEALEKTGCAQRSQDFKKIYGLEKKWGQTKAVLVYFAHDTFSREIMGQVRKKIALANNQSSIPLFVVSNDVMERTLSVLNFIEKERLSVQASKVTFLFPQMQLKKPSMFWEKYIPVEYLFSAFYVCKMETSQGERHYIFYQGTFSLDALKRLYAALGRLNVLAFSNLTLVSVEIPSVEEDRHGLESLQTAGEVTVAHQRVTMDFRQIDHVTPKFTLKE